MRPFAYIRDPLFLLCLTGYFINRLLVKPYFPNRFSQSYFNDLICIPFWLPIMLFLMRRLRMRGHDRPPSPAEILIPLILWSFIFESVAPYTAAFRGLAFGDPADILCYTAGAFIAAIYWNFRYPLRDTASA